MLHSMVKIPQLNLALTATARHGPSMIPIKNDDPSDYGQQAIDYYTRC